MTPRSGKCTWESISGSERPWRRPASPTSPHRLPGKPCSRTRSGASASWRLIQCSKALPSRVVDETILAAPAEPASGNDASAPAGDPAASAFHHGAAYRSPGCARLQPHAGAGRGRRLRSGLRNRRRPRRHSPRASGRQRVGGHLRLRSGPQHRIERRVRWNGPGGSACPDRIAQGSSSLAGIPDTARRHRPRHRSRASSTPSTKTAISR